MRNKRFFESCGLKFLLVLIMATTLSGCARKERLVPANERPMYGGETAPSVTAEDIKQNEVMIRQTGSPEAAFKKTLDQGLASYQRGYFELAMHHYNRAWLLDPKSPEVFNGFGLVLDAQGKEEEALAIYQKCYELNPQDAMTLARLARQYQNKAVRLGADAVSGSAAEEEARGSMEKALYFYEKAAQEAKLDVDKDFIFYQWAIGLAVKKDYPGAWEKVGLARKHGGKFIEPKFLEVLSKDLAEPPAKP